VAIYHGQEEAVRRLIDEGIDLLVKNQDCHSALSYAIRFKKKLFVLLLAKNGAATNGRKIPQFPDGIGTNINRKDGNRLTLLHYMALGGLESETRMLVQNGAHVEAKGKASATPLHYAARGEYEAVVGILIASGAKIDAKKEGGKQSYMRRFGVEARRLFEPYSITEQISKQKPTREKQQEL
jgi:ankyrin repeat protein